MFPADYIIVAACKDECSQKLSFEVKNWFMSMGSSEINKLEYRQSFCFIGTTNSENCLEKRSMTTKDSVELTQVFYCDKPSALVGVLSDNHREECRVNWRIRSQMSLLPQEGEEV